MESLAFNVSMSGMDPSGNPQILIEGHADATEGDAPTLLKLSQDRANALRDFMVKGGIPAGWFRVQAYGSSRPVCKDSTPACAAENRRVELSVSAPAKAN